MGGQPQFSHISHQCGIILGKLLGSLCNAASQEDDVLKMMNAVRFRLPFIGGGIGNDIAAYYNMYVLSGEKTFQISQILWIAQIDLDLIWYHVDIPFVGHRHGDDPAPNSSGLGLFRPGKFIDSQVDFEAQLLDFLNDSLMAEGEGIEGPGEKGDFLIFRVVESTLNHGVIGNEPVDVVQGCSTVEKFQLGFFLFGDQGQHLFIQQPEYCIFFFLGHLFSPEDVFADDVEGLLAHQGIVIGQSFQQQSR